MGPASLKLRVRRGPRKKRLFRPHFGSFEIDPRAIEVPRWQPLRGGPSNRSVFEDDQVQFGGLLAQRDERLVRRRFMPAGFDGSPDRVQVEAALERIAHRMLIQREWDREEMRTSSR